MKKTVEVKESASYDNFLNQKVSVEEPANLVDMLDTDLEDKEWEKHWVDMPEFEQENKDNYKTVYIHFRTKEDFDEFAKLITKHIDPNTKLSEKTKSFWYPKLDRTKNSLLRWIEKEE
jgi:hypothetical protein